MAKPLIFLFQGSQIEYQMNKVDRTKLYGYKELEVLDEQGAKCEIATLAEDGHTLIGRGGTGMGYLSADGLWCDKAQLRPVDLEGNPMNPVGSSFAAPIELSDDQLTTHDDYLHHTIRAIYLMHGAVVDSAGSDGLSDAIRKGAIYKFPYSFRGGLEADAAFLLANDAGAVFMAVGRPAMIEFVGLQQVVDRDDEPGLDEEDDEMDFGMI